MAGARIPGLDRGRLENPVRRLLGEAAAEVDHWRCREVPRWLGGESSGGVYRFEGRAHTDRGGRPWALVLKILRDPGDGLDWSVEQRFYQSRLPTLLGSGLRSPACLGVETPAPGEAWLWLEDVEDALPGPWSAPQFAEVAKGLGRFNAETLGLPELHDFPAWLRGGGLSTWVEGRASHRSFVASTEVWGLPLVRKALPVSLRTRLLDFWDQRELLLEALDRQPQALCHGDAHPDNLRVVRRGRGGTETVVLDWASMGRAPLGAEAQAILGGALVLFRADAAEAAVADAAIFNSYAKGLREGGVRIENAALRFAYCAAAGLQWCLDLVSWVLLAACDDPFRRDMEAHRGRSLETMLEHRALALPFMLGLGEEARRLLPALAKG